MYYTAHDGRQILDGIAGLWAVNAGHCRQPIVDAIKKQAESLDYATGFQMHQPGCRSSPRSAWSQIAPKGMDHVFFVNSGSEAVDTALKMALAYHRVRGEGTRRVLIGRERGYHGVGFGGISVGGMVGNRKTFNGQLLPAVDHMPHTHRPGEERVLARPAASRARISPTIWSAWSRCTMRPTSPPSSSSRSPAPPAC